MTALKDMDREELEWLVAWMQRDIDHYRNRIRRLNKRIAKRDVDFERRHGLPWRNRRHA